MGVGILAVVVTYAAFILVGATILRFIGLAAEYDGTPKVRVYYGICAILLVITAAFMFKDAQSAAQGTDEALRGLMDGH